MSRLLTTSDHLLDGALVEEWRRHRGNGGTYDDFARWLQTEHGIKVTAKTVRVWAQSVAAVSDGETP